MKYTVDYFINKFNAIPEEQWCMGRLSDYQSGKCVLGHCGVKQTPDGNYSYTDMSEKLSAILRQIPGVLYDINDGHGPARELGDTPKERILNALLLIKTGILDETAS